MNEVVDRICARRSVSPKHLVAPGPSRDELREMARAAATAPDHGLLGPARLVQIPGDRREALADVFAAAAVEAEPQSDAARIEDAKQRSHNGACLIAVIANILENDPRVPPHEQWISVGAAIQNVLLAAESFGYRAKIVSGVRVTSKAVRSAFALKESEFLVGFIAVGSFNREPKELPRRPVDEVLSEWAD
jgi:nitroreductase